MNIILEKVKEHRQLVNDYNITQEDIENRNQNFLSLGYELSEQLMEELGAEKVYDLLMQKSEKMSYQDFLKDDEENYNQIWWELLDQVEFIIRLELREISQKYKTYLEKAIREEVMFINDGGASLSEEQVYNIVNDLIHYSDGVWEVVNERIEELIKRYTDLGDE